MKSLYEIQQDNANHWRVIKTCDDGVRRAYDFPPCKTKCTAQALIHELRENDAEKWSVAPRKGDNMNTSKRTPGPWIVRPRPTDPNIVSEHHFDNDPFTIGANGRFIVAVKQQGNGESAANAEFIVRAEHSFDDLVAALDWTMSILCGLNSHYKTVGCVSAALNVDGMRLWDKHAETLRNAKGE